jgi:hypothetical protein
MSRYETLFLICTFEMVSGAEGWRFERGQFAVSHILVKSRGHAFLSLAFSPDAVS